MLTQGAQSVVFLLDIDNTLFDNVGLTTVWATTGAWRWVTARHYASLLKQRRRALQPTRQRVQA